MKAAYEHVGPVYLRFGRLAVPVINDEATYKFEIGKGIVLKEGTDVTIFATGLCVNETIEAEKNACGGRYQCGDHQHSYDQTIRS